MTIIMITMITTIMKMETTTTMIRVMMTTKMTTMMTMLMTTMMTIIMTPMITKMMTKMTTMMMITMFAGGILGEVLGRRRDLQADLLWQSQQWKAAGKNTKIKTSKKTRPLQNLLSGATWQRVGLQVQQSE